LGRFRGFLRAEGASVALRHNFQQRLEEKRAEDQIKNHHDQGYRHSPEEKFP
jgi:hypothetical protein